MKILALNCGSSSLKYQVYDWDVKAVIAKGHVERIGLDNSFITYSCKDDDIKEFFECKDHESAINKVVYHLVSCDHAVIKSLSEISGVGHRVVHGGEYYKHSVKIDKNVIADIEKLFSLAPLHNPPNLMGIKASIKLMPGIPQVAVFDTAFHQTMPATAYEYAVPKNWHKDYGIRRYGFHGTSHLYVSRRAAVMLGKKISECNIITMHIGNGVSVTAIKNGDSVDTSMGFTPLEGAIMGTRSGDLDPAIPLFMQDKLGVDAKGMNDILNKKSGLLGITGQYADRRDIEKCAESGDERCALAISMEGYKLRKILGMYMLVLGRVDAIVFTAGVGENWGILRKIVLEELENYGISLDVELNKKTTTKSGETVISKANSPVKVFVIPTDEERVIIEDVVAIIDNKVPDPKSYEYTFLK